MLCIGDGNPYIGLQLRSVIETRRCGEYVMNDRVIVRVIAVSAAVFAVAVSTVFAQPKALPRRADIDAKYKWKVEDLFPSDEAWEKGYASLSQGLNRLDEFEGKLGTSADLLARCLAVRDSLQLVTDNLGLYASMKLDEDNRVNAAQERSDRISTLSAKLSSAASFIEPEILTIDSKVLDSFVKVSPALAAYQFYLSGLERTKAHILPEGEEALLALARPVTRAPGRIFGMVDDADLAFGTIKDESGQEVVLSKERYFGYRTSSDRRVREDAFNVFYKAYVPYMNTLGATLGSSVKADYFYAQVRKYPTCLEMSLDRNNIPVSVYHALIDAAHANLAPLHKLAALRKKILGVDTLHAWDLSAPLVKDRQQNYAYEDAVKMVVQGLAPLGKTYQADLQKGFESGWVDVYETEGKGSGAYQTGTYSSHPYVLLNYAGTLEWVFTVAHEMGHAMNDYYITRHEPFQYSGQSLFTAEVASTCNEAVLMKYMLSRAKTKEEKLVFLNYYIDQIVMTFYRQIMLAEFELTIHERVESGGALSADFFRTSIRDIFQKYWGPELVVDSLYELDGLRIPHFYGQYYVYQYATCYAAAQMLSERLMAKEKGIQETYMHFLSVGSSKYPVDILKDAGVDMTTPEPVAGTIRLFGTLVDQMEALLAEK
ncbi:oligoendopeptidase F [candidate division GN15 bacterium]|uniref:Oligopeptidase F n=1 Tax=candidate division GN15 bacterium TaxID=2072418 RepID=A0A855X976_9BACT|nr:MAG: oligoendopeptidase F [candidate division GN15 bacterium]